MTVICLLCLAAGSDGQGSLCPYIKQESPEKHLVFTLVFLVCFASLLFCFVLRERKMGRKSMCTY